MKCAFIFCDKVILTALGNSGTITDISTFIAVDPVREAVVVAIRGTASLANIATE